MSRFFKYVDQCPDIPDSLPDHIMEGDSEAELEFETLLISDKSTEIINAPVEIITVSSSEDELEDTDACTPGLAASEVSWGINLSPRTFLSWRKQLKRRMSAQIS